MQNYANYAVRGYDMDTTVEQLQAKMRRDPDGHLVCEWCGAPVTRGWVYIVGSITLATCSKAQCLPPPPWVHGVDFVPTKRKRKR